MGLSIDSESSKPWIEIQNLSLRFQNVVGEPATWRDLFIHLVDRKKRRLSDRESEIQKMKDHLALNQIQLTIQTGERIGILGSNGAGKSTLCRCISGYYMPTEGRVRSQGACRLVEGGLPAPYPELSGRENAFLLGELLYANEDRKQRKEIVEEALAFSGLNAGHLSKPVRVLSTGMKNRLGLSLASAGSLDTLILDEAFDGVDITFRNQLRARMLAAMERARVTLFVSHSEEQLRLICRRGLVLKEGTLIFDGSIADAIAYYKMASGLMNFKGVEASP